MALLNRRGILALALAGRLNASDSDFWNKKPPADWTPEEIERLLKDSPWAKEVTPTYTSLPPRADERPWSENPPIGGVPGRGPRTSAKVPYHATVRWESAEPIRQAQKTALPASFGGRHVLGVFFLNAAGRDLGSTAMEDLRRSAVLIGKSPVDAEIVQVYPGMRDGFLIGFPKTSTSGAKQVGFSARIGLLALRAKFDTGEMLYHGQPAL